MGSLLEKYCIYLEKKSTGPPASEKPSRRKTVLQIPEPHEGNIINHNKGIQYLTACEASISIYYLLLPSTGWRQTGIF